MNKEQFLEFINGEGKDVFQTVVSEQGLTTLNNDTVSEYLKSENGKSIVTEIGNNEYEKRFKTYKEKQFMKDFEAEYIKKHPDMTEEQKKLMELENELTNYKKKEIIANNSKQLKAMSSEYGLPEDVFNLVIGEDLEKSKSKLKSIGEVYKSHFDSTLEIKINERLSGTPKPQGGSTGKKTDVIDDIWNKTINGGF